ncbi:MAG TPA: hypothetical protein VFU07_07290 [Candidatus Lumbricidophila sp.]|nr:hypothetical protein [Candidatus Lumbricidophila sp.]
MSERVQALRSLAWLFLIAVVSFTVGCVTNIGDLVGAGVIVGGLVVLAYPIVWAGRA